MTRMIIGKYVRRLLEDRTRVIFPGFGNLEVIPPDGTVAVSGKRLDPPGLRIKFDAGYSKDDGILAESMAAGEVMEREEAEQKVLELVDAIKYALDKGEEYLLPETGTFSRDADGKIHFKADPAWVLEPDHYGLESMDLLELEELPVEEPPARDTGLESKTFTDLTPPKPKPRSFRWRVIWLVAGALIVVLVVLIIVPSGGDKSGLFDRQPVEQQVEQEDPSTDVPADQGQAETEVQAETEMQADEPESRPEETGTEEDEDLPTAVEKNFFIIAGSFSRLNNASELQDQLNSQGYDAEVMITENRMYRVSVSSYATKEEAEKALTRIKTEPGLETCWLLSN